jgi:hypothetical protein
MTAQKARTNRTPRIVRDADMFRSLWRWWNTPWVARWLRVVLFGLSVLATWAWLRWHPSSTGSDRLLLLYIGVGSALVVLTTALGVIWITRTWTLRAAGLVGYAGAGALLYLAGAATLYGRFVRPAWMTDLIRALFLDGVTVLIAGMVLWLVRTWRASRDGDPDADDHL